MVFNVTRRAERLFESQNKQKMANHQVLHMLKLAFHRFHMASTEGLYPCNEFYRNLDLFSNETQKVDGLGTLNGQSQCSAPDELSQRAQCAAHTKCHSVVEGLLEAIVVEQDTRGGVDVRMGVLGLFIVSISSK